MSKQERRQQLKAAMVAQDPGDIEPLRAAIEGAVEVGLSQDDIQQAIPILLELEERQRPLAFTDVSREEMEQLQATRSRDRAVAILMGCMGLSLEDGFQAEVLAELHYHNFAFCQRHRFCAEKASVFISMMKVVHSKCVAVQPPKLVGEARTLFEALLARHCRQLPPYSISVFSQDEAAALRGYLSRTFFRHYAMYTFVYTHRRELCVQAVEKLVVPEVPRPALLRTDHELNPEDVPELHDDFFDPEASTLLAHSSSPSEAPQVNGRGFLAGGGAAEVEESPGGSARDDRANPQGAAASSRTGSKRPGVAEHHQATVASAIDDVMKAIDDVMKAHESHIENRMQLPA